MSSEPDAPTQFSDALSDKAPDSVDPERLGSRKPALVDVVNQGPVYVADARVRESGWVYVREWNGTSANLPPQRVKQIRRIHTERYGERDGTGMRPKRVADEDWRERARE
ncbi:MULTISPECIES: hypothetical protein [Salinibaculum]|uniref:hypothetical protein n=1 Tax=Salinibaculum TaxID=2732368 RepID=UPI0030CFB1AA